MMKYLLATLLFYAASFAEAGECIDACTAHCNGKAGSPSVITDQCILVECWCACMDGSMEASAVSCGIGVEIENFFVCFSGESTVNVLGKGNNIPMSDIRVGDKVLTSSGQYETIYAIDHRHPTKTAEFIQIHAEHEDTPLELTPKHMLFLHGNPNPVPASTVQVGDQVQTLSGPSAVTDIKHIIRDGLYSPLTTDGTIVVSGIVASSYSAHLSDNEWITIGGMNIMTHQEFFHKALKPYKYMCMGLSLDLCRTDKEKVAYSAWANNLYDHSVQHGDLYKTVLLSMVIMTVLVADFLLSPKSLILMTSCIVAYKMMTKKNKL